MSHRTRSHALCLTLLATLATLATGCASGGGASSSSTPSPSTNGTTTGAPAADQAWPIKTREHVDLWLHGFAMVQDDTTRVPFFRRGYHDEMVVAKNTRQISTLLDANRAKLRTRLAVNPGLVGAQFLALNFASWEDMRSALKLFIEANGDPRRASSQQVYNAIAVIAQYFQSAADRDWLNTFYTSLDDEDSKFYRSYWQSQQRDHAPGLAAFDVAWRSTYYPKFAAFLNGTRQRSGELLVSLPLDGEGRTVSGGTKSSNTIVVTFPMTAADAADPAYVFAHEAVGAVASAAVSDNVTPAERREGLADRYSSPAAVRGGLMLMEKAAPELADGYARYYLRSANLPVGANPRAALVAAFPLPDVLRDAIQRQVELVLGGI